MGNTISGTITKLLTLLPIVVAIYYFDFSNFLTSFESASTLAFFITAITLFVLGVALKRKILAVRLELSKISFGWGLLLLAVAALLYVYGSFANDTVLFHYESLYFLILAYVSLRIGGGILRALGPLLVIVALSFLPLGLVPDTLHQELFVIISADVILLSFLSFVKLRASTVAIPAAVLSIGVIAWYASTMAFPVRAAYIDVLIPTPLLLLLVPRFRNFATLPGGASSPPEHAHRRLPNGFCSVCGARVARGRSSPNVGLWGLVSVLAVAALLLFTTIPVLSFAAGAPGDVLYSPRGSTGAIIPVTPAGWEVNSTVPVAAQPGVYAVTRVYVPLYHPNTKNYTVYYDMSDLGVPGSNGGPFGGVVQGWTIASNVLTQFGPFQGYLTTYVTSSTVMLAYRGVTQEVFLNGGSFAQYYVALGFVREFENANTTLDTAQFMADLNGLWLPSVTTDFSYSGWTNFLNSLVYDADLTYPLLLVVASITAMAWAVYRAGFSDDRLDWFLTIASAQSDEYWAYLGRLLKRPKQSATSLELSLRPNESSTSDLERIDSSMRDLEKMHLVAYSLVERGADIVSVWRAVT